MAQSKHLLVLLCLVGLATAPVALRHDFWLIPQQFNLASGDEVVVLGQTGSTFPSSLSAVSADRIASARIFRSESDSSADEMAAEGSSLVIRHRLHGDGQALAAVIIKPRMVQESPESFRHYLTAEGAPEALERYERQGLLPTDSLTRSYAKYAKALVMVGESGPTAYQREVGHPLEFVPLSDPGATAPGDSLRFSLLLFGQPLAHARGHVSVASSPMAVSAQEMVSFETDADGEFQVGVASQGVWNVRTLYIVPAPLGSQSDWDVHWATYVWSAGN
jgi:uncharacterized GH25 family protein